MSSAQSRVPFCWDTVCWAACALGHKREGFGSRSSGFSFLVQQSLLIPVADAQAVTADFSPVCLPSPRALCCWCPRQAVKLVLSNGNVFANGICIHCLWPDFSLCPVDDRCILRPAEWMLVLGPHHCDSKLHSSCTWIWYVFFESTWLDEQTTPSLPLHS